MLRMCDSIVFSLRNSSAAISRLVLRSVTSSAISSSRLVSEPDARVLARGRAARLGAGAELAQLAAHLVADAQRAARVELALGLAQHLDRLLPLPRGRERPAQQTAREGRREPRADASAAADRLLGGRAAPAASPAASRTAARARAAQRRRAAAARAGRRAPRHGSRTPRRVRPAARQLGQGEDLPVEAALDRDRVLELVTADRPHHLEARSISPSSNSVDASGQPGPAAAGGHRAAGEAPARRGALLACVDRGIEVAAVVVRPAELEQRPEQVVRVRRTAAPPPPPPRTPRAPRPAGPDLERVALTSIIGTSSRPSPVARAIRSALGVLDRLVVVLEVVLGPAEVVGASRRGASSASESRSICSTPPRDARSPPRSARRRLSERQRRRRGARSAARSPTRGRSRGRRSPSRIVWSRSSS